MGVKRYPVCKVFNMGSGRAIRKWRGEPGQQRAQVAFYASAKAVQWATKRAAEGAWVFQGLHDTEEDGLVIRDEDDDVHGARIGDDDAARVAAEMAAVTLAEEGFVGGGLEQEQEREQEQGEEQEKDEETEDEKERERARRDKMKNQEHDAETGGEHGTGKDVDEKEVTSATAAAAGVAAVDGTGEVGAAEVETSAVGAPSVTLG